MLDGGVPDYEAFLRSRRQLMAAKLRNWFESLRSPPRETQALPENQTQRRRMARRCQGLAPNAVQDQKLGQFVLVCLEVLGLRRSLGGFIPA